jgi:hypothetical protein
MLLFVLTAGYLLASAGVGYLGRNTVARGIGTFILSLLFTPLLMLIAVLVFRRLKPGYSR